jgi:hypothetical protein
VVNPVSYENRDGSADHYFKGNKPGIEDKYDVISLRCRIQSSYSEVESRMVVTRSW